MDIFELSERLMTMDDEAWARHANPWSVCTRFTCLPLIALAIIAKTWFVDRMVWMYEDHQKST